MREREWEWEKDWTMYSSSNHSNGYHPHHQHEDNPFGQTHSHSKDRVRRYTRGGATSTNSRSRDFRDSHGHAGPTSSSALRVSDQHQKPATDFDMAYFHSYAHVGIHEEMIKVCFFFFVSFLVWEIFSCFCLCGCILTIWVLFYCTIWMWVCDCFSFSSTG